MDLIVVFLVGLAVGSFANVLIDRLPKGESVLVGRSRCDWCKKTLRWYELIPVISFVIQGGRCRRCHKPLSIQYPLIELISAIGFVILYSLFSSKSLNLQISSYLIFLSLLVIFVSDLKYQIIPDSMIILGLIGAIGQIGAKTNNLFAGVGAAAFFLLLFLVTRGRGLGLGDVKLAFLLGLLLGFPSIIVALYGAFLTGAIVGVILIVRGQKKLQSKIAFGPFLIIGYCIALVWSDQIIYWWKGIL